MPTLNWLGRDKVLNHHRDVPFHALNKISSGSSGNMIIHADNLLALKALLPRFAAKVKCIYIDPPYNTGNEGWIYNDNVSDPAIQRWLGEVVGKEGEDLSRHDKWLCMMFPRLKLLRELLSDDGAIFISIDDNEQANLKLICDEIFGANNFIAQLVWEKKKKGAFLSKFITNVKEYIFVYCKSTESFAGLIGEINRDTETYPCINPTNPRDVRIIRKGTPSKFKDKNYTIEPNTKISAGNMNLIYLDKAIIENGILQDDIKIESNWRYKQNLLDEFAEQNCLYLTQDNYVRRTVQEPRIKMLKDLLLRVGIDGKSEKIFTFDENLNNGGWGTNEDANDELHKILGKQYAFEFAKPSRLIGKLIQSMADKDSLILDAFAGSGTTAHAVINLNAADGGTRRFILIEMADYAESITAERVRRVGGEFEYYELGAPLFDEYGFINAAAPVEKLREYIWYSETGKELPAATEEKYLLGVDEGTAYYFCYGAEGAVALDWKFLSTIKTRAAKYVIYAEECYLSESEREKYGIMFKCVPDDVRRY